MRISTVIYVERDGEELEVEVTARAYRAERGSRWQPPEPGGIEDLSARIGKADFLLTPDEEEQASEALCMAIVDNADDGPEWDD